jgi:hypothetical protein
MLCFKIVITNRETFCVIPNNLLVFKDQKSVGKMVPEMFEITITSRDGLTSFYKSFRITHLCLKIGRLMKERYQKNQFFLTFFLGAYMHMYVHIHIHMPHVHVFAYVCVYIYMYIYIYICICIYIYMCTQPFV